MTSYRTILSAAAAITVVGAASYAYAQTTSPSPGLSPAATPQAYGQAPNQVTPAAPGTGNAMPMSSNSMGASTTGTPNKLGNRAPTTMNRNAAATGTSTGASTRVNNGSTTATMPVDNSSTAAMPIDNSTTAAMPSDNSTTATMPYNSNSTTNAATPNYDSGMGEKAAASRPMTTERLARADRN